MSMCMYWGINVASVHVQVDGLGRGVNVASVHFHVYVLGKGVNVASVHFHVYVLEKGVDVASVHLHVHVFSSLLNFKKEKFIVNGKCIDPSELSNKYFYSEYIKVICIETPKTICFNVTKLSMLFFSIFGVHFCIFTPNSFRYEQEIEQ
jgi:hypothetical protein